MKTLVHENTGFEAVKRPVSMVGDLKIDKSWPTNLTATGTQPGLVQLRWKRKIWFNLEMLTSLALKVQVQSLC